LQGKFELENSTARFRLSFKIWYKFRL